jgi:hypothetical protein
VGVNICAVFLPAEALNAASTAPIPLAGLHEGSCCPFVVRLLQVIKDKKAKIRKTKISGATKNIYKTASIPTCFCGQFFYKNET